MINLTSVFLGRGHRLYRDQCLLKLCNNLSQFLFYAKRGWEGKNSADKDEGKKIIIQNSEQLNRSFKSYNNLQYPEAGDDTGSQEQKLRIQNTDIFYQAYRSQTLDCL